MQDSREDGYVQSRTVLERLLLQSSTDDMDLVSRAARKNLVFLPLYLAKILTIETVVGVAMALINVIQWLVLFLLLSVFIAYNHSRSSLQN